MQIVIDFFHTYGFIVSAAVVGAILLTSVVLMSVAHVVLEWDPAKAGKIRRVAAVLGAVGHGVEGFVPKWPLRKPDDLAEADAAKIKPPSSNAGKVAILLALLLPAAAGAQVHALLPGQALPPVVEVAAQVEPKPGMPTAAVVSGTPQQVRDVSLEHVREAAMVIAAIAAAAAAAQSGIKASPALKSWSETRAGQIVLGAIASAAGSAALVFATWK